MRNWTLTKAEEEKLRIFERKIVRKIYGPIQEPNGYWRIRTHNEIKEIIKGEDIVKFIKSKRVRWFDHEGRMTDNSNVKIINNWKPLGTRWKGRPRKRWKEDVEMNLIKMKTARWKEKIEKSGGRLWRRPKPTQGCRAL